MSEPTDVPAEDPADEPTDSSAEPAPERRANTTILVVVGLLLGLAVGGVAAWVTQRGDDDTPAATEEEEPRPVESAEAADAFLDAWERSRTATYLSGSLLRRTTAAGAELELPIVVAQRPPDRIVSTGSSVSGVVGGENRVCDEQLDGLVQCRSHPSGRDAEAAVARELEILAGYVEGDLPLYRVAADGSCFDLRLARVIHAPPYGQRARFCFDEASGAPSLQRVERTEGTDEVTLLTVRTEVDDADLERVAAGEADLEVLEDRAGG